MQMFTKIIFFDALPQVFAGLRSALSIALIMAVVAEMFIVLLCQIRTVATRG